MRRMVIAALGIVALGMPGCIVLLEGGGEAGIGMRNDNIIYGYHKVDGDKEGKQAKIQLDLEDLASFIIDMGKDEPAVDPPPTP